MLWIRLKARAEEWSLSEREPPSSEECSELVRATVKAVFGSYAVVAEDAIHYFASELLDFIVKFRKLHEDTARLRPESMLKSQ